MTSVNSSDKAIQKFFDKESKPMVTRHDKKGIPRTAQFQVEDIINNNAKTVIDVGSGPGSVMIELLNSGIDHVVGIDLSSEMNDLAEKRIEKQGIERDRFDIHKGSFLDFKYDDVDAISLHRVLCCHPDREGLLNQSLSHNPEIITLTIPRTWIFVRLITAIFALIAKLTHSFRPYIHAQSKIDDQLRAHGYELITRNKTLGWVQSTYKKQKSV